MNVSSVIDQNVRNLPQAENAAKQLPFANKRPFPQVDQSPFQMSKTRDQLRHIPQSQSAHNLFSTKSHNSFSDSYAVVNGTHRPNKRHCFHEEDDDKENTHRHANTTPKRRESLGLGAFTASPESAKLNSMMMNLSLGSKKDQLKLKWFQDPSRPEFNSITADIVADLVRGKHNSMYEKIFIVDCRYNYEFVGGHIVGACNFPEGDGIEALFEQQRSSSVNSNNNICFVFHCEFSSHRGPYAYNKFKELDKKLNGGKNSTNITFPEIYLLVKGYKGFFTEYSNLCDPQNYRTMNDVNYQQEYQKIKKDKKIISENTKSRIHSGLSKSSMNLFANYKDSPSKDNDLFAETPKKEVTQSKRNLFSDLNGDSLFSPSPAPSKCESKIAPLLFDESQNQEFHKVFGDDAINSLHFEALTLDETENSKKKEPEVRPLRRNSVKMLTKPNLKPQSLLTRSMSCSLSSSSNNSNSMFDDMASPFKAKENPTKPPSCKDLFNTKGTSPRNANVTTSSSGLDFSQMTRSEPTMIPKKSLSSSNHKIRETHSEPNMFMDEDIDTSQTPFRPFNSNRVMSRSFDMSHNNPLRQNSMTGDSIFIQRPERPQSFNSLFNVSKFNNVLGDCVNSHLNLFGNNNALVTGTSSNVDHSETFSGSLPSHLTDSSIGNLSTSGYHSLNNSRNGVQKLDLNFQTRSDPGIELHRSNSSQRLMNSSRSGADSARSFDSESRSNSKDELRQQPVFDEIQTPFKPASLTKSNSGSLEREGSSGHLKLSGKGTNRRAQELKKDLLDEKSSIRLRAGSLGDLRRPQPQLVMTKKREINRQIVATNSQSSRSSPSDKKDWANHIFMKSSPPPSSNHSPRQSSSWSSSNS